ncbi:MAG: hypothetical protein JSS02_07685 [Planctomycetes bacterium]|nr:hypothetical protein [Planctomycetota bacterium]
MYDMRLKFQRDEATRLAATQREIAAARVEGLREGEARGETKGRIMLLQELLGIAKSTAEELAALDEQQLRELAEQLQTQLRNRSSRI